MSFLQKLSIHVHQILALTAAVVAAPVTTSTFARVETDTKALDVKVCKGMCICFYPKVFQMVFFYHKRKSLFIKIII